MTSRKRRSTYIFEWRSDELAACHIENYLNAMSS